MANPFRHQPFGRKPENWTDEHIPTVASPALEALGTLAVYSAERSPNDDIPADRPQYFIAERPNGQQFLIDTQGYNYCRYVARILPAPKPASGADLACFAEGEEIADLIDIARTLRNIGGPSALNLRASEILSRIERRAK